MDIVLEKSVCNKAETFRLVFFIGNLSHAGGTERVLTVIANGLSDRGYPVSIISLWGDGKPFFSLNKKIPVYWVKKNRCGKGIPGNLCYLIQTLKLDSPDFLIDVDIILGCYSFLLKCRFPNLHWISWEHFSYYHHFQKNRVLRKIMRRMTGRYADWLIVLTEEDKNCYQKNLSLHCGISRIYNPVPYESAFSKKKEFSVILAAGRLTESKGFDLLIRSWKLLEKSYPMWQILVVGEGENERKLKKIIQKEKLKRFRLAGITDNIENYYEKAAFFVLPSRSEGFGMVLIEAMHYALPVISYNCKTGPKEIIAHGRSGFLIEPENIKAFADKMALLMKNRTLRREMGENAKKSVEKFNKEKILDEWEALLKLIMAGEKENV